MRILAFETSAKAASCALLQDGLLLGEYYQNSGQTHSRTVMKLAQDLIENCDLTPQDVDFVAWANGPGSFTGIRIGAAAAKGFCWGGETPALPVSTLEAMAYACSFDGIICACMDARRQQVYNALFERKDGEVIRLTEDRAIGLDALEGELAAYEAQIMLVGDGASLCDSALHERLPQLRLLPEHARHQRAAGVALAALSQLQKNGTVSAQTAVPNYLRLSQAERERLARETSKGD